MPPASSSARRVEKRRAALRAQGCGRYKSGFPIPAPRASPRSARAKPRSSMRKTAPTPSSCSSWTPPRPISPNIWRPSKPNTASEARRPHHRRAARRTRRTAPRAGDPVRPVRPTHLHRHRGATDINRPRRSPDTRAGRTLREKWSAQALLRHDRPDLLGRNAPLRASLRSPRRRRHAGRKPRARAVRGHRFLTATGSSFRMIPRACPPFARCPPAPVRILSGASSSRNRSAGRGRTSRTSTSDWRTTPGQPPRPRGACSRMHIPPGARGPVPRRGPSAPPSYFRYWPVIGSYPVMKTSGRGGCPNAAISRASTLTETPGRHRHLDETPWCDPVPTQTMRKIAARAC